MLSNQISAKPHYPILDGLRGVAAMIVVAFHIFEAHSANHIEQIINHGYLAVDFFFMLSGFVIGYAYDDRWKELSISGFFKRRLIRLQPMVILGMIIGAICFYLGDSTLWPHIHSIPVGRVLLIMLIGFTLLPLPISMDIRGWEEMHPLDGPGWSLFFEYLANILYALGFRKLSKTALSILVIIFGAILIQYAVTCKSGDMTGGWSLNQEQLRVGFTRMLYPFFAGLLLLRITKPTNFKNAFLWSTVLLAAVLFLPRLGGAEHFWINGLYESLAIIFVFPTVIYIGASGEIKGARAAKICHFLGKLSYPIYITHYAFIYIYTGWVSNHPEITLLQALPYGLATYVTAIVVAYASLKWYDEPIRAWLQQKFN